MALMPVHRDPQTAFFFDGTARQEFLLIRDVGTGELLDPRTDTSYDRDRFEAVPACGSGTVVSWSVPHTRTSNGSDNTSVVGIVQLDEGPWWWTELRGFDFQEDFAGARVTVRFEKSGPGEADEVIPYFAKER